MEELESDFVNVKSELQLAVKAKLKADNSGPILDSCNDPLTNGYSFLVTIEKIQFNVYICKRNKYTGDDAYAYKARAYLVTDRPITEGDESVDVDYRGKEIQNDFSIKLGKFEF